MSLKESSPLQPDSHLAPRVTLTSIPSLRRGRDAPRRPPAAGISSTTCGTWRELAREHNLPPRQDVSAT